VIDSDISLTKIVSLATVDGTAIRGVLYLLNDNGRFQPYEYEYGDEINIPPAFLKELADVLHKFKLEKVLALDISGGWKPDFRGFEYDYGTKATITVQLNRQPGPDDRRTGLSFALESEVPHGYSGDVYAENERGTHQVFYNHKKSVVDDSNFTIDKSAIRRILVSNGILVD
jgi:hypothetical protein